MAKEYEYKMIHEEVEKLLLLCNGQFDHAYVKCINKLTEAANAMDQNRTPEVNEIYRFYYEVAENLRGLIVNDYLKERGWQRVNTDKGQQFIKNDQ